MKRDYEMITVNAYLEIIDGTPLSEDEVSVLVEKYLNNLKKAEINEKLVEELLA